ncbi:MAG TPA: hypothetical protein VJ746_16255 [Nitrospira sp.]|nr:hypothetical protein [Nitrospira sp.]
MKPATGPDALFYPFHLCHHETLARLLTRFRAVHFRDFMALQLTPWSGTTAFRDRMGDHFPQWLSSGRLVQGYDVSGPIPADVSAAMDRDLEDEEWRSLFHAALHGDHRFRLGLFGGGQADHLLDDRCHSAVYSVARVRQLVGQRHGSRHDRHVEYGLALVKTSASLVYTYRLAITNGLQTVTDSASHYDLFERSCRREAIVVGNHLLVRKGY